MRRRPTISRPRHPPDIASAARAGPPYYARSCITIGSHVSEPLHSPPGRSVAPAAMPHVTYEGDGALEDRRAASGFARTWAASTFEAFSFPAYRVVWLGSIIAFLAFNMSWTAQSVVAYDLTGSNRAVGTVMFGQGIAMFVLNPFGGAIADRFSKRFLILFAQSVIGAVMLTLAILLVFDKVNILILSISALTVGSMFSFLGPTRTALLGDIVSEERIGNAMALLQVGGNFTRIGGPFVAGSLLAWPLFGSTGTYFVIASMFILVIFALSKIPPTPPGPPRTTSVFEDVRLGLSYIRDNRRLLHTVLSFHAVTVVGLSYFVLMPGFAKDVLDAGTAGLGVLLGVAAAGGFVGSLFVASLADSPRAPRLLRSSSLVAGVALVLTGLAPSFPLAILTMIFVAGGISAFQTLNNVIALRRTDPVLYGRVISLVFIAWGMINLISLPVGYLADVFGERVVLAGAGVTLCSIVLLFALWERRLGPEPPDFSFVPASRPSTGSVELG